MKHFILILPESVIEELMFKLLKHYIKYSMPKLEINKKYQDFIEITWMNPYYRPNGKI